MNTIPPRVLITGGTGFIGTNLTKRLLTRGIHVDVLSRREEFALQDVSADHPLITFHHSNLTDEDALARAVRHAGAVFHLASNVNGSGDYAEDLFATESLMAVLQSTKHAVDSIVFGSTASVYGEGVYWCLTCGTTQPTMRSPENFEPACPTCQGSLVPHPTRESAELNGKTPYARTKRRQEQALTEFNLSTGIGVTLLRFGTVYGPGQSIQNAYGWFARSMLSGAPIQLVEDGLQTRDFVYIDDVATMSMRALADNNEGLKIFNVGTGRDTTLLDFFQLMGDTAQRKLGLAAPLITTSGVFSPDDVRHCRLDIGYLDDSFDFVPFTELDTGIESWLHYVNNTLERQTV
jgi:dTDP-L-rhamnose 4-epimerase